VSHSSHWYIFDRLSLGLLLNVGKLPDAASNTNHVANQANMFAVSVPGLAVKELTGALALPPALPTAPHKLHSINYIFMGLAWNVEGLDSWCFIARCFDLWIHFGHPALSGSTALRAQFLRLSGLPLVLFSLKRVLSRGSVIPVLASKAS